MEVFNEAYRLREKGAVLNWFDVTEVEGHLSLNSKFGDIMATLQGKMLLMSIISQKKPKGGSGNGFDLSNMGSMMDMMKSFTLLRLTSMMGMVGISFTKEELLDINAKLNRIKSPKK